MFGIHLRRLRATDPEKHVTALQEFISLAEGLDLPKPLAVQFFLIGPGNYSPVFSCAELKRFKNLLRDNNIRGIAHGAFVDVPWKRYRNSIENIAEEMYNCSGNGMEGIVIHLGPETLSSVEWVVKELALGVAPHVAASVVIYLEIVPISRARAAEHPNESLVSVAELTHLFQLIRKYSVGRGEVLRFGLCIDTAHLHASGMEVYSADAMQAYLDALLPLVWEEDMEGGGGGGHYNLMFHLNDCSFEYGAGRDKHDNIGTGLVWTAEAAVEAPAWRTVVQFAKRHNLYCILETPPDGHAADLHLISAELARRDGAPEQPELVG